MNAETHKFRKAITGGIAATMTITLLMYMAPFLGLPGIDMASAIGGAFTEHAADPLTAAWWVGFGIFFLIGGIISPIILLFALPALFGNAWQRGAEWGILVWVFGGVWAMHFLGLALNEPHFQHPAMSAGASLAAHVIYGMVLGIVGLGPVVHTHAAIENRA